MIKKDAEVNGKDAVERTPLHYAAMKSFKSISLIFAMALVMAGAGFLSACEDSDISPPNQGGQQVKPGTVQENTATAADGAKSQGVQEEDINIEGAFEPEEEREDPAFSSGHTMGQLLPIHAAAGRGDLERVRSLLTADRSLLEAKSTYNHTPLRMAADNNRVEVVKYLISKGAKLDAKDNQNFTALHESSKRGNQEMVALLIKSGADVDAKTRQGHTPLHFASKYGHPELVKILLDNGAEVNAKDNKRDTPLHFAASAGCAKCAEILVGNGAEVNAKDFYSRAPLHYAAAKSLEVTKLLMDKGAQVNARDAQNRTPLKYAKQSRRAGIAVFIKKSGGTE